jgi:hypothetical protein
MYGGLGFSLGQSMVQIWRARKTRKKADYSTFYVSVIIFRGFPAIKNLGSF